MKSKEELLYKGSKKEKRDNVLIAIGVVIGVVFLGYMVWYAIGPRVH
jgi:hypothetical protein